MFFLLLCMSKPKIFWLDDHPQFSTIKMIDDFSKGRITHKKLLEHTTFAYDFETGEEILRSGEEFDLYIMDGDFPVQMKQEQKQRVDEFFERLKQDPENSYKSRLEGGYRDSYYSAFIEFTIKHLQGKPFVIHSMSQEALNQSFLLGFPFYKKGLANETDKIFVKPDREIYHNEITQDVRKSFFETAYQFVKQNPRWEPVKNLDNWYQFKKENSFEDWEFGGSEELVEKYLVPLIGN